MAKKHDLDDWVNDALIKLGGSGRLVDVVETIWEEHNSELEKSGDLFYTWQYDMRWAADRLRRKGAMRSSESSLFGIWMLK